MVMFKPFIRAVVAGLLILAPAHADTFNSADRTTTHAVASDALGEQRRIYVRTPIGYDPKVQDYPVVYVLDAEWNFELVASYLDYMKDNGLYPPMIVVGVENVNRNRDYVPRADANFDDTGRADAFLEFVETEWVPFVDQRYPTSAERILVGHSFGGVFTLHALFKSHELFDAYFALGSSAWIADRVLFEEAEAFFENTPQADEFVYMAVGEGDGGPTVPSSRDLAALFEEKAPASLEWTYDETSKTDHFKNVVSGMHDGFMALFPAWEFEAEVAEKARAEGAEGVNAWFDEKEAALGYRFVPAWFDMGVAALMLGRDGHHEAALALMARLRDHHPNDAHVASFGASVFENAGRLEDAEAEFARTIKLTNEQGLHPNAMHLDRLERGLERVRAAQE